MNIKKEIFSLKKLSVSLIAIPYFAFNFENITKSTFFSLNKLLLYFFFILIVDILIKWLLSNLNEKSKTIISILLFYSVIIFFYSVYIVNYIQFFVFEKFEILIRGRSIIKVSILILIVLLLSLRKKRLNYLYVNIFLFLFFTITFISSISNFEKNNIENYKNSYIHITENKSTAKPVLLIICDEYTSPDGLYNVYKDSSIYEFSNSLTDKGWNVKNSFYSYETSTIYSLSSLFNFNLSKDSKYKRENITNIGSEKLLHSSVADSLDYKKVEIINFGIFHFGKHPYLTRIYIYPTSFFDALMMNTIFYTFSINTGNFNKKGFTQSFYPMEKHNKYIFENLVDTLSKTKKNKTFIYTHLYMPHNPFQYNPEFPLKTKNLNNYRSYWDFTNKKIGEVINSLTKNNNYRIILCGDHGFRSDKRINSNYTFAAFYGFDEISINKLNSVQDLGSLINSAF